MKYRADPVYRLDARNALRLRDNGVPLDVAIARQIAVAVEREVAARCGVDDATERRELALRLMGTNARKAYDLLQDTAGPLGVAAVAAELGVTYDCANTVLRRMTNDGILRRVTRGMYEAERDTPALVQQR